MSDPQEPAEEPSAEAETEPDLEPEPQLFGARRGWSVSRRLRSRDSYGALLLLILGTLLLFGLVGRTDIGRTLVLVALLAVLMFALRTSAAGPGIWRAVLVVGPIVVLVGALSGSIGEGRIGQAVGSSVGLLLIIGALVAITRRVGTHPRVDGATVLGALCVYLLIAFMFAATFSLMSDLATGPFLQDGGDLVDASDVAGVDLIYFSLVTIGTVGYGDVTMLGDLPRLLAATEGVMGQLYLVTVVALLVGNLGRPKNVRGPRLRRAWAARKPQADPPG